MNVLDDHAPHQPLHRRFLTPVTLVALMVSAIGIYFIAQRFMYGLGAVTNLNQGYPWGIWVVFDVVIGTAFGCGGFAMALLVYVLNRNHYHVLVRPALLGGLFGYTLAGMAVMIDLGRYWQFYNLLTPWYAQPNSVMFEVALCVMAYVTVLWIEFAPAALERFGLTGIKAGLEKVMFLFIGLGVLLPTMHQSSLGSVLLVMGSKLSPLWYTPLLPLLFVSSALMMGYGVVMFETTVVSSAFKLHSEQPILARLGRIVGWLIVAWLAVRAVDLAVRNEWELAFRGDLNAIVFWIENLLFGFAAWVLLAPHRRARQRLLFLAAVALILGGSLYRLDAYLIAYRPVQNYHYFPAPAELMVTFGVIALEVWLYLLFIYHLPILPNQSAAHKVAHHKA
jgi:Ni/Fe-hydrogenase subunit HybB-like protein